MIKLTEKFGARGIKVPWEGVFQFQSKPTWSMLEIFPGVSKKPELRPTCLWVMPKSPTQRNLSSLVIKHQKAWSLQKPSLQHLPNSHKIIHFYFLTQTFNTTEPCLEILSDQNVWQFERFETPSYTPFGRWHSPERSLRNQSPKIWFSSRLLPVCEL